MARDRRQRRLYRCQVHRSARHGSRRRLYRHVRPYADTPKFAGTIYTQVKFPIENVGEGSLRADLYGQMHTYFSNLNDTITPGVRLRGYHLVNLRAQLAHIGGSELSVAAYAKNLLGEKYYAGGLALGAQIGVNGAIVGQPRKFGLELGYKF